MKKRGPLYDDFYRQAPSDYERVPLEVIEWASKQQRRGVVDYNGRNNAWNVGLIGELMFNYFLRKAGVWFSWNFSDPWGEITFANGEHADIKTATGLWYQRVQLPLYQQDRKRTKYLVWGHYVVNWEMFGIVGWQTWEYFWMNSELVESKKFKTPTKSLSIAQLNCIEDLYKRLC